MEDLTLVLEDEPFNNVTAVLNSVPHAGRITCHRRASSVFVCRRDRVGGGDTCNASTCGRLTLILQDLSQLLLHFGVIEDPVGSSSTSASGWPRNGRSCGVIVGVIIVVVVIVITSVSATASTSTSTSPITVTGTASSPTSSITGGGRRGLTRSTPGCLFELWWLVVPMRVLFLVEPRSNRFVPEVFELFRVWHESQKSLHPLPQHHLAKGLGYSFSRVFQHRLEKRCKWV